MKDMAEDNMENWKVVLTSMTQFEKENPNVIKKRRIERIAKGSGKSYSDIKSLLKQYDDMKKMISQMTKPRRGKKGAPGMPAGMPDLSKLGM